MSTAPSRIYPGEEATPRQVLDLADEYRNAAGRLRELGQAGKRLSFAPFRSASIHAIELYLNAFLLHRGHPPGTVRGLHHDMAKRAKLSKAAGLRLRAKTERHLHAIGIHREYLASRYDPEAVGISQINQLESTLAEVSKKVSDLLGDGSSAGPALRIVASQP